MAGPNKHPILIVDDEPEILYSLRSLLRLDFQVHTAQGGAEALQVLQQHPIDVVLTDQRMPEMTGVELLHRVEGQYPEAVRIVFTGYADIKSVIQAINQGKVYRYITKPWDPDELREILQQACAEHDHTVERRHLLTDVRTFLTEGLPQWQGQPPQAEAGRKLLDRVERIVTWEQRPSQTP